MLAWLQRQLKIYVLLRLIPAVQDLNSIQDDKTKACLAHRFFCDSVDLIGQMISPDEQVVYALFKKRGIDIEQPEWLMQVYKRYPDYEEREEWIEKSDKLLRNYVQAYQENEKVSFTEWKDLEMPDCLRSHTNRSALEAVKCVVKHQAKVQHQLEFVQAKMMSLEPKEMTELEQSIDFGWIPSGVREQHERISLWLREVKGWFSEAERIRQWISHRIRLLEQTLTGPLEQLNRAHETLESEVDRFDRQDMARLRAHVKALTGSSKDLSPADTSTIEITFSTLMLLDRLQYLLRVRGYELHLMTLKSDWQQAQKSSLDWVQQTSERLKEWTERVVQETDGLRNQLTQGLVGFETQCTVFDQGQWALTVELYQGMNDASHESLSEATAADQTLLVNRYQSLTQQLAHTRLWVDQHLAIADFLAQAEHLKQQGTQLDRVLEPDAAWADRIAVFEQAITTLVARIPSSILDALSGSQAELESLRDHLHARLALYHLAGDIQRLVSWADDRIRALKNQTLGALDTVDLRRLRKERDAQLSRLQHIRQHPPSSPHTHPSLQSSLLKLTQRLDALEQALHTHTQHLDTLEAHIHWTSAHAQATHAVLRATHTGWHCVQLTQWRPGSSASPDPSLWTVFRQEVQQVSVLCADNARAYRSLIVQPGLANPEHSQRRHETLQAQQVHLEHLAQHALAVIEQRQTLVLFTHQACGLHQQGTDLLDDPDPLSVEEFCSQVERLWTDLEQDLVYPLCESQAWTTRPSTDDDTVQDCIQASVRATYDALCALMDRLRQRALWLGSVQGLTRTLQHALSPSLASPPLAPRDLASTVDRLKDEAETLTAQAPQAESEALSQMRHALNAFLTDYARQVKEAQQHWQAMSQGQDPAGLEAAYGVLCSLMGPIPEAIRQEHQMARTRYLERQLEAIHVPGLTDSLCPAQVAQAMVRVESLKERLERAHAFELKARADRAHQRLRQAAEMARIQQAMHRLGRMQDTLEEHVGKSGILMNRLSRSELKHKLEWLDGVFEAYEAQHRPELSPEDGEIQGIAQAAFDRLETRWQGLKGQYRARKRALITANERTRSSLPVAKAPVYVADPKNDLDMEIGRIVNNAPYKVKVKMVPGEVGRYWFGDQNPKLAYCRVLKSKMVMVRVGGGWAELSKFLRDHALLEVEPRSRAEGIHEAFIETRKAVPVAHRLPTPSHSHHLLPKPCTKNNKPVPSHRSHSLQRITPNPSYRLSSRLPTLAQSHSMGYKHGDKFITVDEYGNQQEVKMRRCSKECT